MKLYTFILLLALLTSSNLFAQNDWKTQMEFGISISNFPDNLNYSKLSKASFSLELHEAWNKKNEQKFSIEKNIGIAIKFHSLDKPDSGTSMAGWSETNGGYIFSTFSFGIFPQLRIDEETVIQLGPYFEQLIFGHQHIERSWHTIQGSGVSKISEFNRDLFNKPYYGLIIKFINEQPNLGVTLGYLFTEADDSNFHTKNVIRFSILFQL